MPKESNFTIRLSKAAKELNVGKDSIVEFLAKKGFQIGSAPNTKISAELYSLLVKEFRGEKAVMDLAKRLENYYYKGGGVSVESTIKTSKVTTDKRIEEKTNTICKKESRENCVPKVVERKDENKEISIENKEQTKVEYDVAFSELKFEQGYISFIYDKKYCIYRDYKIRDYNKILEKIYNRSKKGQEAIKASIIRVIIDIEEETFVFKDIDIRRYVNRLKDVFLPENKDAETLDKIQLSEVAKEINMDVSAIRKFLIKKGFQVDSSPNAKLTAEMYALLVKEKKEILVSLSKFYFGPNYMSLKKGLLEFVLWEKGISPCLNSEKSIKNTSIKIFLDYSDLTFQFKDLSLLSKLKDLSAKLEKEKRIQEKEKTSPKKIQLGIPFSELKFGQGVVSIIYKERQYVYRNNKIKDYDSILEQIYNKLSYAKQNSIKTYLVKVVIDMQTESFTFKDIDIRKLVNDLKNRFLNSKKANLPNKKIEDKDESQKTPSAIKSITLRAGNIHFYNGYYLIFQTNNGEVDNTVTPYRVDDPNSHEILNLVHKYFEQIFEQKRIIVKIDETKIIEPSRLDLFQLSNYVRELKRNLDEKDVWWEEVQNVRKRSFVQCCGEPTESVKKRVAKSKNEYLYNLSSLQNEKKLIRVYEINHGKEEDAFIFTISMSNNRSAIVFENASKDASTTTWIFVAKDENYEPCINLVFDYFTDYTISLKRSSLRETINPPEKYKAESYASIYHDDIGQWLKKLNKILGQTPEPSEIQFVPGLHIPESSETRTGHGDTITTKHLHNQLMRKLYDKLCEESGKDNVGTEIRVGAKRIDTVVKGKEFFDIYEIKTATNPFDCVTEALGQLCQYAYLYCPDKIGKLVIVGPSETTKEVEQYLSMLRKNHSLQLYYMKV